MARESLPDDRAEGADGAKRLRTLEEDDDIPPQSGDKVQDAVRANRLLANKKKAVASQVPPGQAIPYVDSNGGVYDKIKLPAAAPTALPAPTLPEMVNIFEGSPDVKVPVWHRYSPVANVAESHAVLVKDAQSGLNSISGLLARLHGKRLVDQEWVMTKMKKGFAISFGAALQRHLYLFLDESFVNAHREYAQVLLEAPAKFEGGAKSLHVAVGALPEKPKHPRLSFQVVSQAHLEQHLADDKSASSLLNLEQCLNRLTSLHK